jgi:aconitase B
MKPMDSLRKLICKARVLSQQIKGGLLKVCKIGQKCVFSGNIIPRDGDIDPYWDTIDANPVR